MRIAVCLSGQSRTWKTAYKNILHFFNYERINEPDVQVDYFIHTWNNNNWRNRKDPQWKNWSEPADDVEKIKSIYNPVYFEVENFSTDRHPMAWDGLLYSFMKTIHNKKRYEVQNNFYYDVVVKTRLDTIFNPSKLFNFQVSPLFVYSSHPVSKMLKEFNYNNFSDVMFYSDSQTMDILGNAYRYSKKKISHEILANQKNLNILDPFTFYGPGAILYDYMVKHGIYPTCHDIFDYAVVRRDCEHLDSVVDFEEIRQTGLKWYN